MMNELSLLNDLFGTAMDSCMSYNTPDVDVIQNKDNYVLSMDLPGLSDNDVDISIKDNVLTVKSAVKKDNNTEAAPDTEKSDKKSVYLIRERRKYNFERCFALPRDVNADNITATFTNGVLDIVIGRKEEPKARSIKINAA